MSVTECSLGRRSGILRQSWLAGTIVFSVGAVVAAIWLAPPTSAAPGAALSWLLIVASSMHVASTAWFYTLPEIRAHARTHHARYITVPLVLIAATAAVAASVSPGRFVWALLVFFGWQFYHFQKQNLGMAALAGSATGAGSLGRAERISIIMAGLGGIAGLMAHPELLQVAIDTRVRFLFPAAFTLFVAGVLLGLVALARRPRRTAGFTVVYLTSLLFFLSVFCFHSPYAAVAGITIAHGYQYLLLVGFVAGTPRAGRSPILNLAICLDVTLVVGLAIAYASRLQNAHVFGRLLFGAYLGAVMAHFIIDAGLWRMRDEFPRRFLSASVPYLLRG